jgi:hypothetical protein
MPGQFNPLFGPLFSFSWPRYGCIDDQDLPHMLFYRDIATYSLDALFLIESQNSQLYMMLIHFSSKIYIYSIQLVISPKFSND